VAQTRTELALTIPELTGRELVQIKNVGRGWPALAEVKTRTGRVSAAFYVGPIGRSHRARDAIERRFQNPGANRPISLAVGTLPILLGIWNEERNVVFVGMNAMRRVGRGTRHSLFMPLNLLRIAAAEGWAEHQSESKERVVAFAPRSLPAYVEEVRDRQVSGTWPERL
jgi:hypothetical protein